MYRVWLVAVETIVEIPENLRICPYCRAGKLNGTSLWIVGKPCIAHGSRRGIGYNNYTAEIVHAPVGGIINAKVNFVITGSCIGVACIFNIGIAAIAKIPEVIIRVPGGSVGKAYYPVLIIGSKFSVTHISACIHHHNQFVLIVHASTVGIVNR